MHFTDIFIKRPVLAISVSLFIVILGLQSIFKLAVREYPEVTNTVISVTTNYTGASASMMQSFITSTIEEAAAQADNIDYITSSTTQGSSTVTAKMRLNTNPESALTDILSKVNAIRYLLPNDVDDPNISSSAGGSMAIMYIGFTSDELNSSQVTDFLQRVVRPQFFTIPGISNAQVLSGSDFALRIWLDPDKLASLSLSADDISRALAANNIQSAAGNISGLYTSFKNDANTTTASIDDLKKLVVTQLNGNIILLEDIAEVSLDKISDTIRSEANGVETVFIALELTPNANILTVADDVKPVFEKIKANLPPSIQGDILYDASIAINASIDEVKSTIFEASIIVLIIVTLFLGSLRSIIIPIITIPISIIGALMVLNAFGCSINLITLLAIVLAIGLVVDDAIVVLENIDRHIKLGKTPFQSAIIGTREIALPVISMTIVLCAVYAPMMLMEGLTGSLFKEFSLTLASAVFISGIIALTLSPMMCSKLLRKTEKPTTLEAMSEKIINKITVGYKNLLSIFLINRKYILIFSCALFALLPLLTKYLSSELAPHEDKGFVFLIATAPPNTNVDYMFDAMRKVSDIFSQTEEVAYNQILTGIPTKNDAIGFASLVDWNERKRSQDDITNAINAEVKNIPEIDVYSFPLPELPTGDSGMPVQIVITTPNSYEELVDVAQFVLEDAQASGQFIFNTLDLKFNDVVLNIEIDKEKAGSYGINMAQISSTLSQFLSGGLSARVSIDGRSYNVITQVKRENRLTPEDINSFYVKSTLGEMIPLGNFITLSVKSQPTTLAKFNQLNSATISGLPISSVGDAVDWFKNVEASKLPAGYQYDFLGEARQLENEGNSLLQAFILSILVVFLILAIQFESFRDPMVILISVPLAVSGSLLTLNILGLLNVAGATLNIYSQVGLITLIGLITKHGILMCEVAKEEQILHGKNKIDAIASAAAIRLRPILMTTAAMIAGLIPLLYASGAGAISRFSMGSVIISGLAIGTLFTLFVVPVIYCYIASEHKPLADIDI